MRGTAWNGITTRATRWYAHARRYVASWLVFLCWVELFAYCFHYFFHLKFIYRHFHKLHHKFQPPTAYSAVAFHPIEFACCACLPRAAGPRGA